MSFSVIAAVCIQGLDMSLSPPSPVPPGDPLTLALGERVCCGLPLHERFMQEPDLFNSLFFFQVDMGNLFCRKAISRECHTTLVCLQYYI